MANTSPWWRRRRWGAVLAVLAIALIALVGALPWALSTGPARRWLLRRANRALAPGSLEFVSFRPSWFGPARLTGLTLRDRQGEAVVAAPRVVWDRKLGQILFGRPRLGTLMLDGAVLDVERGADGSVDLYEALRPVLGRDPRLDLTVRVDRGRLRFRAAGQPEAVEAGVVELALAIPAAPRPLTWQLRMARERSRPGEATLEIQGRFERWQAARAGAAADLAVEVSGHAWPGTLAAAGVTARGRFDGRLAGERQAGRWRLAGQATVEGCDLSGPRLAGDHVRLGRVEGAWDLAETPQAWEVRRLALTSALAAVQADGPLPAAPGRATRVTGTLDLAAIARQLPRALPLRKGVVLDRGAALVRVDARSEAGLRSWDLEARVSDLEAHVEQRSFALREPATLTARVERREAGFRVPSVALRTAFLDASAQGDTDRGIAWKADVDLARFQDQSRDLVDWGAVKLAGKGRLAGDYRRAGESFAGKLDATLSDLEIVGILPLALRRDAVRLDATASGPATPSGLPQAWAALRLGLTTGEASASLVAHARGEGTEWTVDAQAPASLSGRPREVRGHLAARWAEREVSCDELWLTLSGDAAAGVEPLVLAARGRFDRSSRELTLKPAARGPRPAVISLSAEGVRVSGIGKPDSLRVEGGLVGDVAGLRRAFARDRAPADSWSGTWALLMTVRDQADGLHVGAKLDVRDLALAAADGSRRGAEGPITASLLGLYLSDAGRLEFQELALTSRYARAEAAGRLDDLRGRCVLDVRGRLTPAWDAINDLLARHVEPGARVAGNSRPFALQGPLTGAAQPDLPPGLEGDVGLDLTGADFYGMRVGPTPIVMRARQGRLRLDPIETTLSRGRLHLEPELVFGEDDGAALRLGPGSTVEGAQVNDEVSRRVLAFVVPVLDQATRVHGRVSVTLKEALFPIGGRDRGAKVDGSVLFQDVEFAPGPLAGELFSLVGVGRDAAPALRLNEPVALTIHDRRVYQSGLALPLGKITRVELEGWVDFDRNLAMTASLPLTAPMVANNPVLGSIVEGTRLRFPIRGTLDRPEIDRQAMSFGMKDLGRTLLERTATRGALELLERLIPGRDPDAPVPPRLTPEERKAQRQERKAQRRARRGLEP